MGDWYKKNRRVSYVLSRKKSESNIYCAILMWFVVNAFFLYLVFGVICKLWHELNYVIKVVLDETMNSSVLMMRFDKIMEKVKWIK